MNETEHNAQERTAVDDVRIVREKIAREHGGDLQRHVQETNRIAETLRLKLNVRRAPVPPHDAVRIGS